MRQNKASHAAGDGNSWRCSIEATERSPKDSDSVGAECSVYLPSVKFCSSPLGYLSSRPKLLSLEKIVTVSVPMYRLRRNIGKYFEMCRVKRPTSVQSKGDFYGITSVWLSDLEGRGNDGKVAKRYKHLERVTRETKQKSRISLLWRLSHCVCKLSKK
jgi:hypothetical protein